MITPMLGDDPSKTRIAKIKEEREAIQVKKRTLTRAIKNEKRKRERLVRKSSGLKDQEILELIRIREERRAKRAAAEAATSG